MGEVTYPKARFAISQETARTGAHRLEIAALLGVPEHATIGRGGTGDMLAGETGADPESDRLMGLPVRGSAKRS